MSHLTAAVLLLIAPIVVASGLTEFEAWMERRRFFRLTDDEIAEFWFDEHVADALDLANGDNA